MPVSQFITFGESSHKFTDPIRFFKENDPYVYLVDNIPLSQLSENSLWLRDQLSNLTVTVDGIERSSFNDLRPYVLGTDEKVRVLPGRYTGRINDVYKKQSLIKLIKGSGLNLGDLETYSIDGLLIDLETALQDTLSTAALSFNGLAERCSIFSVLTEDTASTNTTATYTTPFTDRIPFPIIEDFLNNLNLSIDQVVLSDQNAAYFHNKFIQMWRGVARTSIVDIPEEISISIPKFDADDFFVTETDGTKTLIPATQRIDLVFIYSHPIDASSTWINKDGIPEQITRPTLGIVKGAGIGLKITTSSGLIVNGGITQNIDGEGNTQILPSVADEALDANGFSGLDIHGSFPSPDDLMNMAPLLVETLVDSDYQLIGQSVLPVAYILVRNNATQTIGGQGILTTTDLVDIRPFFRTAELTYNERAGIVASIPPLSLANPAVGQIQLDTQMNAMRSFVDAGISTIQSEAPRIVAGGLIRGGLEYGVEGAILKMAGLITYDAQGNLEGDPQFSLNQVLDGTLLGNTILPRLPEWDISDWASLLSDGGTKRNDWLNIRTTLGGTGAGNQNRLAATNSDGASERTLLLKKKINIINPPDFMNPENGGTYEVQIEFENCAIASYIGHDDDKDTYNCLEGTWVERHDDYFIIYVIMPHGREHSFNTADDRDRLRYYQVVTTIDHADFRISEGFNVFAPSIYPTVSWKLIGYPSSFYRDGTGGTIDLLGV